MSISSYTPNCQYNYVVTAHKPTAVTQAAVGSFTGSSDVNLIVAKCSHLEIHKLTAEGLQGMIDIPVYGRISVLKLFRPKSLEKDVLFVLTERYRFCVLEYVEGELRTRANGDLKDQIGRPTEAGHIGIVDPSCSLLGFHLYDGHFKVIPLSEDGTLSQAINVRLEELKVIDINFLYETEHPTIAVLYEDTKGQRNVKTYQLSPDFQELEEGPWSESHVDQGSTMLIPVPGSNGCIIVGEKKIQFFSSRDSSVVSIAPSLVKSYSKVGSDGTRYLLGDIFGNLLLLAIEGENGRRLRIEKLGETSQASSLCYLDSGVVFVGSALGDSQLVKLHSNKLATGNYTELVDTMPNLGPIVDFAVVDLDRQGQGQIIACSGAGKSGSLRVIRNGIGFNEQASIELNGVKGLWSLKRHTEDVNDSFLIISFIEETRFLGINIEDELDEIELPALDSNKNTIFCANISDSNFIQVTDNEIRLVGEVGTSLISSWRTPNGELISAVAIDGNQVAVAVSSKRVYIFACKPSLVEKRWMQLGSEVSCVDCANGILAVGLWDMTFQTYQMENLNLIETIHIGDEAMARSILITQFDDTKFVLCGLGDGSLLSFQLNDDWTLCERKKLMLGTRPITLRSFRYRGKRHIFAASDRPTVIHSANGKLLYSNLNESEVNHIASFHTSSFPDSLALIKPTMLKIGSMDSIQKLHVRSVPLHEQPRRIACMATSKSILVSTTSSSVGYDSGTGDRLRLLDEQTFELMDSFKLEGIEMVCSVACIHLEDEDKEFYAVGSAFLVKEEIEPSKGRICLFSVHDGRLVLVSEVETNGAVYNLTGFQKQLLAGINSRIQLYRWKKNSSVLSPTCGHSGHTIALYVDVRSDFIIVGDLMKSLQLLVYRDEKIELYAKDFNPAWMTSTIMLNEQVFIGADSSYNMFSLKKFPENAGDEERSRLEVVGQYHLGDYINCFRRGSLVMKLPDSPVSSIETILFATISGSVGVVASLPKREYEELSQLQDILRKHIKGIGGFDHRFWRSFDSACPRPDTECKGFLDGDLLEQILDLSRTELDRISDGLGDKAMAARLFHLIEDLSRLH